MAANPPASLHSLPPQALLPKRAIPRLPDPRSKRKESNDSSRVPRACANCRRRKVKCSAGLPRCRNCHEQDIQCVYPTARKDRLQAVKEQNGELIQLLKDLSIRVNDGDKKKINNLLDSVDEEDTIGPAPDYPEMSAKRQKTIGESTSDPQLRETDESASSSLSGDLDMIDSEKFRRRDSKSSSAEGNSGRPSHKSLKPIIQQDALHLTTAVDPEDVFSITKWADYLDDVNVELEVMTDRHELPVPAEAQKLFDFFIETIQITFPLLSKDSVQEDLRKCYDPGDLQNSRNQTSNRQKANLNLIFAIASYHSSLMGDSDVAHNGDHLVYFARARLLEPRESDIVTAHPDLLLIQGTGLRALYYLFSGHLSSAWSLIGVSLRHAMAIGLQLPNAEYSTSEKARAGLWWGLRNIEFLLSSGTGRSCVTSNDYCPEGFPQTLPSGHNSRRSTLRKSSQPAPASPSFPSHTPLTLASLGPFTEAYTRIGHITQSVITQLYSPRSDSKPWQNICPIIKSLEIKLEQWADASLPRTPTITPHLIDSKGLRQQIRLEFYYTSTMILTTKPCLFHLRKGFDFKDTSFGHFEQSMAKKCIEAAKRMTLAMTHDSDRLFSFKIGPRWAIVHNVMQALSVFLHELSYGHNLSALGDSQMPHYAKTLIRWIRAMKDTDVSAEKAYQVIRRMLENSRGSVNSPLYLFMKDENSADIGNNHSYGEFESRTQQPVPTRNHATLNRSMVDYPTAPGPSTLHRQYVPFETQPSDIDFTEFDDWSWQFSPVFQDTFVDPFSPHESVLPNFRETFSTNPLEMPSSVSFQQSPTNAPSSGAYEQHPQVLSVNTPHSQIPTSGPPIPVSFQNYRDQGGGSRNVPQVNQVRQGHHFSYLIND